MKARRKQKVSRFNVSFLISTYWICDNDYYRCISLVFQLCFQWWASYIMMMDLHCHVIRFENTSHSLLSIGNLTFEVSSYEFMVVANAEKRHNPTCVQRDRWNESERDKEKRPERDETPQIDWERTNERKLKKHTNTQHYFLTCFAQQLFCCFLVKLLLNLKLWCVKVFLFQREKSAKNQLLIKLMA